MWKTIADNKINTFDKEILLSDGENIFVGKVFPCVKNTYFFVKKTDDGWAKIENIKYYEELS